MATVAANPTETILEVWRRGVRLEAVPGKYKIRLYQTERIDPHLLQALIDLKPTLIRRLRRPKGWPRYEPFPPPWWDMAVLPFEVTQARLHECSRCGYSVAVRVENCRRPGWYCPRCGQPVNRKGDEHA